MEGQSSHNFAKSQFKTLGFIVTPFKNKIRLMEQFGFSLFDYGLIYKLNWRNLVNNGDRFMPLRCIIIQTVLIVLKSVNSLLEMYII